MADTGFQETQLYAPVKALLEGQGYEVKGEVGCADVVAVNHDGDTVIVELKKGFSLSLFHQAVERQRITDAVYVAVPRGAGRAATWGGGRSAGLTALGGRRVAKKGVVRRRRVCGGGGRG